jgi:hypothetical protein
VILDFPEPMDYIGLQKTIAVSDGRNQIAGTIAIERQETRWTFTPREPWKAGNYRLMVSNALEDLAANKMGQLFDMDAVDSVNESVEPRTIPIPFSVR